MFSKFNNEIIFQAIFAAKKREFTIDVFFLSQHRCISRIFSQITPGQRMYDFVLKNQLHTDFTIEKATPYYVKVKVTSDRAIRFVQKQFWHDYLLD